MKKLLFIALATFIILSCSSDDNMPCVTCIANSKSYCFYYSGGSNRCNLMSVRECEENSGDNYGNDKTCGDMGSKQDSYAYCLYYSGGSSSYRCSSMSTTECKEKNGKTYGNDKTCDDYMEQQGLYSYCLYLVGGNYKCDSMSTLDCNAVYGGENYKNDNTCGNRWWSSSSVSSSSSEYTEGSCNIEDYGYINIGYQTWMTENLNCYKPGSKCYDDDPDNCDKYGRLYDWATAKQACPDGSRLPSKDDWEELIEFVLYDNDEDYSDKDKYLKAEKYLKVNNKSWGSGKNGNDIYEFAALPGGWSSYDADKKKFFYNYAGSHGYWWSFTEQNKKEAYNLHIYNGNGIVYNDKSYLFSVRCLLSY